MLPCPRRIESSLGAHNPEEDHWEEGVTCSWCGSLNPELLLRRLEQGDVVLGPSDKNYKVYVENNGGENFPIRHKKRVQGTYDKYEWVVEQQHWGKFYFQHFNSDQQEHFIRLMNEKRINYGPPGYFYRLPFFVG